MALNWPFSSKRKYLKHAISFAKRFENMKLIRLFQTLLPVFRDCPLLLWV